MNSFEYSAFISYSHQDKDWAVWLQQKIESYRIPKNLRLNNGASGFKKVFRDQDELPSGNDLNKQLIDALASSEFLIVICSKNSINSQWVKNEVDCYKRFNRTDKILCLLVDDCPFPEFLTDNGKGSHIEPLASDPRDSGDGKDRALLKLYAAMLGTTLDNIVQRERVRRRYQFILSTTAIVIGSIILIGSYLNYLDKQYQKEQAESLASFAISLGEKLQHDLDLPTQTMLYEEALGYLGRSNENNLSKSLQLKLGQAWRQLGIVQQEQGLNEEAETSLIKAVDRLAILKENAPDNIVYLYELSLAYFYLGTFYYYGRDYELAREPITRYVGLTTQIYESDPNDLENYLEYGYALNSLLALKIVLSDVDELDPLIVEIYSLIENGDRDFEKNEDMSVLQADSLSWVSDAKWLQCKTDALEIKKYSHSILLGLTNPITASREEMLALAFSYAKMSHYQSFILNDVQLDDNFEKGLEIVAALYEQDPSNIRVKRSLVVWNALDLSQIVYNGKLTNLNEKITHLVDFASTELGKNTVTMALTIAAEYYTSINDHEKAIETIKAVPQQSDLQGMELKEQALQIAVLQKYHGQPFTSDIAAINDNTCHSVRLDFFKALLNDNPQQITTAYESLKAANFLHPKYKFYCDLMGGECN